MLIRHNLLVLMLFMRAIPASSPLTNVQAKNHWSPVISQVNGNIVRVRKGGQIITFTLPRRPDLLRLEELVTKKFLKQGCLVVGKPEHTPGIFFTLEVDPRNKKIDPFEVVCRKNKLGNAVLTIG